MDAKTHRLRNNFILLKNEGNAFNIIAQEMHGVNAELLKEWDKSYDDEIEKIKNHFINEKLNVNIGNESLTAPYTVILTSISGIKKDGCYIINNNFSYDLTEKDKVIFDLWQVTNIDLKSLEKEIGDINFQKFQNKINKCKLAFDVLKDQLLDIEINKDYLTRPTKFKNKDQNKSSEVNLAIQFYLENIYHPQIMKLNKELKIEKSKYCYHSAIDILPIAVKYVLIKNYQGIQNLELADLYVDSQWIFITGENGFGKTNFLKAITIGLFGSKDQDTDRLYGSNDSKIIVEYKQLNQSIINQTDSGNITSLKNLVCYGPTRLSAPANFTKEDENKSLSVTHNLFSDSSKFLNIENRLIVWKLSNDKKFDYVVKIFKLLIPNLADIKLSQDNSTIIYVEKEIESNRKYQEVDILQLASGYRSIINMVGDMILRFYINQPDVENPSEFTGIVVIDEFDLHWHPKLQIELPSKFSEIFPFVQFIVSTHSAIPLLGAPKNSTIIKINRTKSKGITAEKLEIDVTKLTPNIILTSPIFDMGTITSKSKVDLQEVRTEDDYQKMKSSDNVDEFLKERERAGKKYPDILFA